MAKIKDTEAFAKILRLYNKKTGRSLFFIFSNLGSLFFKFSGLDSL